MGVELIKNLNNGNNQPLQNQKKIKYNHTSNTPPINIPAPKTLIPQLIPISQHEMDVDDQLPDNEYIQDPSTNNVVSE